MKKVMVTMPESLHEALQEYAAANGASVSGLMRVMAIEWLKKKGYEVDLSPVANKKKSK